MTIELFPAVRRSDEHEEIASGQGSKECKNSSQILRNGHKSVRKGPFCIALEEGAWKMKSPGITPKIGLLRSLLNGRLARTIGASSSSPSSAVPRRGSERRRTSTTMYVPRDNGIGRNGKEKSTYVQVHKRDDQLVSEKPVGSAASGSVVLDEGRGASDIGKKKILLLKGKEKEIPHLTSGLSSQQSSSSVKLSGSGVPKQNQQREASGRIIRSILVNKDARQSRSEQQNQAPNQDMDRRPPRYSNVPPLLKDSNSLPDDKVSGHDVHGFYSEKQDKRTRNKDRPDRGVWTPLRRSDGSHASDESLSSLNSQSTLVPPDSAEGTQKEGKYDLSNTRGWDFKPIGSGRGGNFSVDNGIRRELRTSQSKPSPPLLRPRSMRILREHEASSGSLSILREHEHPQGA
ncbi:Nucleotide-binding, alpha-beta plait [Artemisia annua]|uniref:Nucleotide-binding, alpha-beta plait n=1 Tax=Artemisia annua TaxID=35608 RepID=A0A2U1QC37_ARTAN|nr:Nucleotide-binding, alpha-beta plait [Artemisia annua]